MIPPLLRLVPLERLMPRLGRPGRGRKRPGAGQQAEVQRRVRGLLSRLPAPWRETCLTRSVVLYHLLRKAGIPLELCIGVRRKPESLDAHAWLMRDGATYGELPPDYPYAEIVRFPGSATG